MTLEELVQRCKAGVSLEVNTHKNYYETVYGTSLQEVLDKAEKCFAVQTT